MHRFTIGSPSTAGQNLKMPDYVSAAIQDERRRPRINFAASDPQNPTTLAARAAENLRASRSADDTYLRNNPGVAYREGPGIVLGRTGASATTGARITGSVGVTGETPAIAFNPPGTAAPASPRVDTDALINSAIQSRQAIQAEREGLQAKRAGLTQELANSPVDRHGRPIVSPDISSRQHELDIAERNLQGRERFSDFEATTRMNGAFRNAAAADKHLEMQRHTQVAEAGTRVMNGIAQAEAQYKYGSPELHNAIMTLTTDPQNAGWIQNASAASRVRDVTSLHDKEQAKTQTAATVNLNKYTGLTPQEFAALDHKTQVKAGGILETKGGKTTFHEADGGFSTQTGRPKGEFSNDATRFLPDQYKTTPWENIPKDVKDTASQRMSRGGAVQIDTGKGYPVVMPRTQYESFKQQFVAPEPIGKVQTAVQTTGQVEPARDLRSSQQVTDEAIAAGRIVTTPERTQQAQERIGTAPQVAPVAAPTTQAPAVPQSTPAPVIDHAAALNWANANKDDPRAQEIIKRQNVTQ